MCENETEIYVVVNNKNMYTTEVVYVGTNEVKAQEECDRTYEHNNPSFIQVWREGEREYITRMLD